MLISDLPFSLQIHGGAVTTVLPHDNGATTWDSHVFTGITVNVSF